MNYNYNEFRKKNVFQPKISVIIVRYVFTGNQQIKTGHFLRLEITERHSVMTNNTTSSRAVVIDPWFLPSTYIFKYKGINYF